MEILRLYREIGGVLRDESGSVLFGIGTGMSLNHGFDPAEHAVVQFLEMSDEDIVILADAKAAMTKAGVSTIANLGASIFADAHDAVTKHYERFAKQDQRELVAESKSPQVLYLMRYDRALFDTQNQIRRPSSLANMPSGTKLRTDGELVQFVEMTAKAWEQMSELKTAMESHNVANVTQLLSTVHADGVKMGKVTPPKEPPFDLVAFEVWVRGQLDSLTRKVGNIQPCTLLDVVEKNAGLQVAESQRLDALISKLDISLGILMTKVEKIEADVDQHENWITESQGWHNQSMQIEQMEERLKALEYGNDNDGK